MADEPDITEITIRHPHGQERQIPKYALAHFPDWERVDSQGRKVTTPTTSKEN